MLSVMTRHVAKYRLRQVAATALIALASSPSAASFSSSSLTPSSVVGLSSGTSSTCIPTTTPSTLFPSLSGSRKIFGVRGGSTGAPRKNNHQSVGRRTTAATTVRSMTTTTTAAEGAGTLSTSMKEGGDTMTPAAKLDALRSKMKELNLDVYLVPSDDPHLSGKRHDVAVVFVSRIILKSHFILTR